MRILVTNPIVLGLQSNLKIRMQWAFGPVVKSNSWDASIPFQVPTMHTPRDSSSNDSNCGIPATYIKTQMEFSAPREDFNTVNGHRVYLPVSLLSLPPKQNVEVKT